jgi:hypothetical protein
MYYWKKKESRKGANKKCYPKPPEKKQKIDVVRDTYVPQRKNRLKIRP